MALQLLDLNMWLRVLSTTNKNKSHVLYQLDFQDKVKVQSYEQLTN